MQIPSISVKTKVMAGFLVAVMFAVMLLGWVTATRREARFDAKMQDDLMRQAIYMAGIINPEHAKALTFTDVDLTGDAADRIRAQMVAFGGSLQNSHIYTARLRDESLVIGLSVYSDDGAMLSPPGTHIRRIPASLHGMFDSGDPFVLTPRLPQYTDYASAFAPIFDPNTGEQLMLVGVDVHVTDWRRQMAEAWRFPMLVMLFLLVLILMGTGVLIQRDQRMAFSQRRWWSYLESVLIGVFCLVITASAMVLLGEGEERRHRESFVQMADARSVAIEIRLRAMHEQLHRLSTFMAEEDIPAQAMFRTMAAALLGDKATEAVYWIPRVPGAELNAFTARLRSDSGSEQSVHWLDDAGGRLAPTESDVHYPIQFVESRGDMVHQVGLDLFSLPMHRAIIEKAAQRGVIASVSPLHFEGAGSKEGRMLIYCPVYSNREEGGAPHGYIAQQLNLTVLLHQNLASAALDRDFTAATLLQLDSGGTYTLLASYPDGTARTVHGTQAPFETTLSEVALIRPMHLFSQPLLMIVYSRASASGIFGADVQWIAGLIGVLISMLLTALSVYIGYQQAYLEYRIWERTAALKEREETFRRLFNDSTDPTILIKRGHIVDCNEAAVAMLRYRNKGELLGVNAETLSPPRQPDGRLSAEATKDSTGRCIQDGHYFCGHTLRTADGVVFPAEMSLTLLSIRGEKHIHLAWRDITERLRAEVTLRQSEENYRTLVDSLPLGLYRITSGTPARYIMVNKALVEIHGFDSPEEFMQQTVEDIYVNPEDRKALLRELIRDGYIRGREVMLKRKDGSHIWAAVTATVVRDGLDNIEYFDGSVMDVTERRQAVEERIEMERRMLHAQKLESLGVLAGGIAHDFNNLLLAIQGNLELALDDLRESDPVYAQLDTAMISTKKAAVLTEQMLAYSGKGKFVVGDLDLSKLITDNAHMLRASVGRNVTLNLHLEKEIPPILADEGQVQQVVMNLLINAAEAVGDKAGTVAVFTGVMECDAAYLDQSALDIKVGPGRFVWIEVVDNGCGMNEEVQRRIFEPFYTTKFAGRGLGLSAVLGIMQGHKGALRITSEEGKGSAIRALFPASTVSQEEPKAEEIPAVLPPQSSQEKTHEGMVLIVDDEEVLRDLSQKVVTRFGFNTITACDGEEAVALFKEHCDSIILVLLDLTMPRMDGVAAYKEMQRIKPDVRVILCSGFSEEEAKSRVSGSGILDYIHKPYRIAALKEKIEKVLF